jgi:hypothetical protein
LKLTRIVIALVAIATVCGCAAAVKPRGAPAATMPTTAAAVAGATAASDDAHLTLAEIKPVPHLPTTQPSTRPAPLDAVVLYA